MLVYREKYVKIYMLLLYYIICCICMIFRIKYICTYKCICIYRYIRICTHVTRVISFSVDTCVRVFVRTMRISVSLTMCCMTYIDNKIITRVYSYVSLCIPFYFKLYVDQIKSAIESVSMDSIASTNKSKYTFIGKCVLILFNIYI